MDKNESLRVAVEHTVALTKGGVIATKGGASLAVSSGLWAWFGQNHTQIAAVCAMIGATCALGGLIYTVYRDIRNHNERHDD